MVDRMGAIYKRPHTNHVVNGLKVLLLMQPFNRETLVHWTRLHIPRAVSGRDRRPGQRGRSASLVIMKRGEDVCLVEVSKYMINEGNYAATSHYLYSLRMQTKTVLLRPEMVRRIRGANVENYISGGGTEPLPTDFVSKANQLGPHEGYFAAMIPSSQPMPTMMALREQPTDLVQSQLFTYRMNSMRGMSRVGTLPTLGLYNQIYHFDSEDPSDTEVPLNFLCMRGGYRIAHEGGALQKVKGTGYIEHPEALLSPPSIELPV